MKRRGHFWLGAFSLLSVFWAGCIVEEESGERTRFDDDETVETGVGAGGTGAGGFDTTVTTGSGADDTSGSGGASSSITTGAGAGPSCDYESPNSCLSADTITEIAGDAGEDVRVIHGTTSRFVKVFVAETVGSVISYPDLKFAALLENSAGMDFDLNVYPADAEPHCDGEVTTATTDPAVIVGSWGDSLNSDDGRWMIFEVVHTAGSACDAAAEWTLTIAGNCDGSTDCL